MISSLQKSVFYNIDERKIFENIANLAIEVFKKQGEEFLSFDRLKGCISNPNLTAYQGFVMALCMKHCMVLSFHKYFMLQRPGTQRSDRAELPPLFEVKLLLGVSMSWKQIIEGICAQSDVKSS